jgi:hypothetical protein
MSDEPLPGAGPADRELRRRWHQQFDELPDAAVDARIRDAARGHAEATRRPQPQASGGRLIRRWTRFAPLAAAASVALLAVGLVRLMPREEYAAFPAARESAPPAESPAAQLPAAPAAAPPATSIAEAPGFVPDVMPASPETKSTLPHADPTPAPREEPTVSRAPSAGITTTTARRPGRPAFSGEPEATARQESDAVARLDEAAASQTSKRPMPAASNADAVRSRDSAAVAPTTPSGVWSGRQASQDARTALPSRLSNSVRADAAARLGLDPDQIGIISVAPITWLDGSLGCGDAVQLPVEAPVPGYVVTVDAAGTSLRYHTDEHEQIRVCDDDAGSEPARMP